MIHSHSLEAYNQITAQGAKDTREKRVLEILSTSGGPMSDYQILQVFKEGSDNLNLVQPRISDLYEKGILTEGPRTLSHDGRRNVRTSLIRNFKNQMEMF